MDVIEIRHRNLLVLLTALEKRGIKLRHAQAQQLGGLGSSYLSQLRGGKTMGEETARKIEVAMGKPYGWLDMPRWEAEDIQWEALNTALPSESQSMRLDVSMIAETVKALRIHEERHGRHFSMETEEGAALFVHWYAIRQKLPAVDVLDNLIELVSWRDQAQAQGASENGRAESLPVTGIDGGKRAKRGPASKG